MKIEFIEILDAFDFASFGQVGEAQAFLDKETGKIYFHSDYADAFEELPEDIEEEKYIEIPHKNELGLGKKLVLRFASMQTSDVYDEVEDIFRRKGAYSKFKDFLERKGVLDDWYEYEQKKTEEAIRKWCDLESIEING